MAAERNEPNMKITPRSFTNSFTSQAKTEQPLSSPLQLDSILNCMQRMPFFTDEDSPDPHQRKNSQTVIQLCMQFMEEPSQFSVGQTPQSLTCSIMEEPHTVLDDCENAACFRNLEKAGRIEAQKIQLNSPTFQVDLFLSQLPQPD